MESSPTRECKRAPASVWAMQPAQRELASQDAHALSSTKTRVHPCSAPGVEQ
jgi:hypothetical protein